ncbi:hypothetical protein [Aquimarina sp. 2201CG5-10]|uniref:hypothetical protein n=1 Tax=Aquimarina callyspongiae TaxID=3098150 RepID=UPI002AB4AE4B|nr:hypothetical protein [Aquimarina sp. 2201CG5-10]MDY8137361.1 hypothetical protein [Aquimarina sp. 2201CG5-10]
MKNNSIAIVCLLISATFFIACQTETGIQESTPESTSITKNNTEVKNTGIAFDVYIQLVDENSGQPVSPETLPGYYAKNLDTGEYFYTSRYEVNLFESLPVGTYRFDAYDGYFDGASSAIVEVGFENETPEGWIEVTLSYWSE